MCSPSFEIWETMKEAKQERDFHVLQSYVHANLSVQTHRCVQQLVKLDQTQNRGNRILHSFVPVDVTVGEA